MIHHLGEKATVREIARNLSRESNSISEQISRMEKKGLLKKIRDVPGTIITKSELTESGFKALDFARKRESLNDIMSVLSDDELKQFELCLHKILSKAREMC